MSTTSSALPVFSPQFKAESHADYVRVPCLVFFVVTPIFIAIRLYNRVSKNFNVGLDDAVLFISFACKLAVEILMMLSVNHGFGRHIATLSKPEKLLALELFYVAQIFYKLTINLTKISILLLYLRIFVKRWFRVCAFSLIGIVSCYIVASMGVSIWQCTPIRAAWDKSVPGHCVSLTHNWYANAGFSIATDVLILALPLQPIWTSKLPVNQKRALIFVFLLGFFVTITSILRATTLNFSTKSPDTTYDIASTLWTMIEQNVAIICACLPMCRIVLAMILPTLFGQEMTSSASLSAGSYGVGVHSGTGTGSRSRFKSHPAASYVRPASPVAEWKSYEHSGSSSGRSRGGESGGGGAGGGAGTAAAVLDKSDAQSEEYILSPIAKRHDGLDERDGAIVKTIGYEVSYDKVSYSNV